MSQFSTPAPKSKQSGKTISPYMNSSIPMERAKAVDLVSDQAAWNESMTQEFFFVA
jgi:hypothetical protein